MNIVFSGPTIHPSDVEAEIDCICLPPAKQGDVLASLQYKPTAIGIIDGYFDGVPSVWHKEILYAIEQGVCVLGSASMGALRARELDVFGMTGVGLIYQWYRDGVIEDDDEVALVHGPADTGFLNVSEPMVNIRATLDKALLQSLINEYEQQQLLNTAKRTFYKQRNWRHVIEMAKSLIEDKQRLGQFTDWIDHSRINQKKEDALAMLRVMKNRHIADELSESPNFRLQWTYLWDRLYNDKRQSGNTLALTEQDLQVVNELRLLPQCYERYYNQALIAWLLEVDFRHSTMNHDLKVALTQFRKNNHLDNRNALLQFLSEHSISEEQLESLLKSHEARRYCRGRAGNLELRIKDQLLFDGRYVELLDRHTRKISAIDSYFQSHLRPTVLPVQLLHWYFKECLQEPVPSQLHDHLDKIDLDTSQHFYSLIEQEFLFHLAKPH